MTIIDDPVKLPDNTVDPAPGSGQTNVSVTIGDDTPAAPQPRAWGSLSLFEKIATIVVSFAAVGGALTVFLWGRC